MVEALRTLEHHRLTLTSKYCPIYWPKWFYYSSIDVDTYKFIIKSTFFLDFDHIQPSNLLKGVFGYSFYLLQFYLCTSNEPFSKLMVT